MQLFPTILSIFSPQGPVRGPAVFSTKLFENSSLETKFAPRNIFLQAPSSQAHPNSQAQTPPEAETVLPTLPSGGLSLEPAYSLSGHRPMNLAILLTRLSNTQNSFIACDSFVWLLLLKTYKIFYLSKMSTVLLK